jgi:hypothetical protein
MQVPVIPADLTTLSVAELEALSAAIVAWATGYEAPAAGADRDEDRATMSAVMAGYQSVLAEMASRPPAAPGAPEVPPSPTLAEMAASIAALAPPAPPSVATPQPASLAPVISLADFQAGIATAVQAAVTAALPAPAVLAEGITASGEDELDEPDIGTLQHFAPVRRRGPQRPEPLRPTHTITASAGVPGYGEGQNLATIEDLGMAVAARRAEFQEMPTGEGRQKAMVARIAVNMPEDRILSLTDWEANARKIEAVTSFQSILAAGGSCAPVQPYYGLLTLGMAERPTLNALAAFVWDRMGVSLMTPPTIDDPGRQTRVVTDGATNTNTTVTSATAAFLSDRDKGADISATGIPAGAYIVAVVNATTVTISAAATATATGLTLTIVRRGATGQITEAQDAAALDGTDAQIVAASKFAYHVTCPSPTTYKLRALYWMLEGSNWTDQAYPELMAAWVRETNKVYALMADSALLTEMSALSTAYAATGVVDSFRSWLAQVAKVCAYLRDRHMIPEAVPMHVHHPRFLARAFQQSLIYGSGNDSRYLTQTRAIMREALNEFNINTTSYIGTAAGKAQRFAGAGGVLGAKLAGGGSLAYPTVAYTYIYPEGHFMVGLGRDINFGTWRDSYLNERNNFRMGGEGFEKVAPLGPEAIELASTLAHNGVTAGDAYGSSTASSPVAIPVGL